MLGKSRRAAFWLLDKLKGSPVRNAYLMIKKIDIMDSDNTETVNYVNKHIDELIAHSCKTTEFYKKFKNMEFSDFPIITKNDIRQNQDMFFSDVFDRNKLYKMSTSGSTGTPFTCYQNEQKKRHVNAEIIYYSEKVGYKLGENLSYIRNVVKEIRKSSLKQFIQNQTMIQCEKLADENIEKIISEIANLSKREPLTLLAYASTYTAIKDYAERHGIQSFDKCKINGMISGSDMLYDETRLAMEKLFNCNVVSRYSNEENGVIGQDEGINNVFTINEADYYVEIFDDNGKKLSEGAMGRIVVTDLFNYAMPMIRYDTGDIGAIETIEINGRKKKVISNFSGRATDVITDADGSPVSPHMITNNMWAFTDISQFQLIQTNEAKYLIRLNANKNYPRQSEIINVFKRILGEKSEIDLEFVEEIPVMSSGKRRYIINQWKQQ